MRDILFRGKRSDNGEWMYGDLLHPDLYDHGYAIENFRKETHNCMAVNPETIGQFTGLYDKNGKKIFEGDVVKTKFSRLCIIEWFSTRACCGWDLKPVDTLHNICHTKPPTEYDLWEDKNLEVVDNIHDNPEFRKVAR